MVSNETTTSNDAAANGSAVTDPVGEADVGAVAIRGPRVGDGRGVDVDAGGVRGDGAQQRRAVAFAARGIEHAPARGEAPREGVAVTMLVRDLAAHAPG